MLRNSCVAAKLASSQEWHISMGLVSWLVYHLQEPCIQVVYLRISSYKQKSDEFLEELAAIK
jgi:hypothetical protein